MLPKHYEDLMNLAGISGHEQKIKHYMQDIMKT